MALAEAAATVSPYRADSVPWAQAALDVVPTLMAVLDGSGTIVWVNRAWRDFVSAKNLATAPFGVGQDYATFCQFDRAGETARVNAALAQVAQGAIDEFTHDVGYCDRTVWYQIRARRIDGADPVAILVMHEDVTAKYQSEEDLQRTQAELEHQEAFRVQALAQSAELHRHIIESLPGGVIRIDSEGNFVSCNAEALRCFNLTEETVNRTRVIDFGGQTIYEDGRPYEVADYPASRCLRTGKPQPPETIGIRRPDGSVMWAVYTAVPVECPTHPDRSGTVVTFLNITERKRAELALRDSEERYRLMFEHNPQPMWAYDVETLRFLAVNEAAVRHYGYYRQEFLSMSLRDLSPPGDFAAMEALLASGASNLLECTWRQRKRSGEIIEVQMTSHGLTLEGRRANLVLAQDVTVRRRAEDALRQAHEELERRVRERTAELARTNEMLRDQIAERARTEAALRESEARFRQIVEHIREIVWILDVSGPQRRILYISPTYEQVYGQPVSAIYDNSQSFLDAVVPEDRDAVIEGIAHHSVEPYDSVYRIRAADGKVKWIRSRSSPIRDADGNVYRVTGIAEDITDLKVAQLELARLASIVESSDDSIIGMSLAGRVLSWNSGAAHIYGYTAAEMVGQDVAQLMQADERTKLAALLDRVAQGERVESFETVRLRKDGSAFHVSLTVSSVKDADGHVIGASAIERDITIRRRLEQEVLRIGERERRRIGQDLHDGLGQHLTGIAFLGKSLQHRLETKVTSGTQITQDVAAEAAQIADLVQQAIGQTRALARGLHPVEQSAGGLQAALQDLATRVEAVFRLRCRVACDKPTTIPDDETATHLYRIAQEAVNNAVKYASANEVQIRLECTANRIKLSVSDDGVGLPDAAGKTTPGLGLRIMRYRAKIINGSLSVGKGANGVGTVVTCEVECGCGTPMQTCLEEKIV